jgi:hypothetical protein
MPADLIRMGDADHCTRKHLAELESAMSEGEALVQASRFVGDEEDLYFWRLRRAEWSSRLPRQVAGAGSDLSALEDPTLSIAEELSRDVRVITDIVTGLIAARRLGHVYQAEAQGAPA